MSYLLKKYRQPLNKQSGVVIVVALFIIALVAAMSLAIMERLQRDTRRTTLILRNTQADLYAEGALAWARDVLINDWIQQKPNQRVDAIPIRSPNDKVNSYQIRSIIWDMQARFNLNNLSKQEWQESFAHLLQLILPKLSEAARKNLVRDISEWITPGSQQGESNEYYLHQTPPYRMAKRLFVDKGELRLVKGVTPAIYAALEPYITALPQPTNINVSTAPAPVLATLAPNVTLEAARAIEKAQASFGSNDAFLNFPIVKNYQIQSDKITVISNYFLLQTEVVIENQHIVLYTLLERVTNGNKANVNILWQSKGVW